MVPTVSIIIPVFNQELHIRECLESITKQTYQQLQIIVVDDCSTDHSIGLINKMRDERIIIIRNEINQGLAYSVNKAITISGGKFLARMDADDIAHPDRISKQIQFLQANPSVSIVGTDMQSFGYRQYLHQFPSDHDGCKAQLLFNVCFGHPTVMFRREVFEDPSAFYNESLKQYSEEYDLWCRLVDKYKFANISEPLLQYRTFAPDEKAAGEKKRRCNSRKIRNEFIKAQLPVATDADLDVHDHIANLDKATSQAELAIWLDWLDQIGNLNSLTQSFSSLSLQRELEKRSFELSYWNTHLGASQWRKTIARLGFGHHFSILTHIKFFFKSVISR